MACKAGRESRRVGGVMSLTVYLTDGETDVYRANITHNLIKMAGAADLYEAIWQPFELGAIKASDIIPLLENGLHELKSKPDYFNKFNSSNGWGMYHNFVPFVEQYLAACKSNPDAVIHVSR